MAEGKATVQDFIDELIDFSFDDIFICSHSHKDSCSCRMPTTGMLTKGAEKHNLNLENCIVIGDRWSDLAVAFKVNWTKVLVKTGAGHPELSEHFDEITEIDIEYVAENIKDAADWISRELDIKDVSFSS